MIHIVAINNIIYIIKNSKTV